MLVGETINIVRVETQPLSWQASSASVAVTQPGGTVLAPSPNVTITPDVPGLTQTLAISLSPTIGGAHSIKWQYSDTSGETILRRDERFATWTEAKAFLLERLQTTDDVVDDMTFEREFASAARRVLGKWPVIGNGVETTATKGVYNLLTGDDQEYFDEAIALMVCARLVGPISTGGGASDLVSYKEGDQQYQFGTAGSERQRWIEEAADLISMISDVASLASARSTFSPFVVSGFTRAAYKNGEVQTILGDVIHLLSNDFDLSPAYGR